jgi:hypothetical protein
MSIMSGLLRKQSLYKKKKKNSFLMIWIQKDYDQLSLARVTLFADEDISYHSQFNLYQLRRSRFENFPPLSSGRSRNLSTGNMQINWVKHVNVIFYVFYAFCCINCTKRAHDGENISWKPTTESTETFSMWKYHVSMQDNNYRHTAYSLYANNICSRI